MGTLCRAPLAVVVVALVLVGIVASQQGPLTCWSCSANTHGLDCYDLDHENKTLSKTCNPEEVFCTVRAAVLSSGGSLHALHTLPHPSPFFFFFSHGAPFSASSSVSYFSPPPRHSLSAILEFIFLVFAIYMIFLYSADILGGWGGAILLFSSPFTLEVKMYKTESSCLVG